MGSLYSIAFKGEVAAGYAVTDVKAGFADSFNKGDDVIGRLFSGAAVTLAKNLDLEKANAAATRLRSLGAVVYVVDDAGIPVETGASANDDVVVESSGPAANEPTVTETDSAVESSGLAADEPTVADTDSVVGNTGPAADEPTVADADSVVENTGPGRQRTDRGRCGRQRSVQPDSDRKSQTSRPDHGPPLVYRAAKVQQQQDAHALPLRQFHGKGRRFDIQSPDSGVCCNLPADRVYCVAHCCWRIRKLLNSTTNSDFLAIYTSRFSR